MIFPLRPYQQRAEEDVRELFRRGKRRPLIVMPCGAGKTVTFCSIVRQSVNKGKRVLVLSASKEIIDQTSRKLDAYDVPHGVMMGDHWRRFPELPVQVGSVQTLMRRDVPEADLIVIDEAHHARASTYEAILAKLPKARVIGCTATPWRSDGRGLGELFDSEVVGATTAQLMDQGYLCRYGGYSFEIPDVSRVALKGPDYAPGALELAVNQARIVKGVVTEWVKHAGGVRTICFAAGIAHSRRIVEEFKAAGVAAEHLDGTTPKLEREAILARLAAGTTRVLSNMSVLTEGWDCPSAQCCILARPTKSLVLYLQMVGRVLRPDKASGKDRALIFDHAGLLMSLGLPEEERDLSLEADVQADERPPGIAQCPPPCGRVYPITLAVCPECGRPNTKPASDAAEAEARDVREVEARMVALDEVRSIRAMSLQTKAAELKRLLAFAKARGFHWRWAIHRFKATFGHEPFPMIPRSLLDSTATPTHPPFDLKRLRRAEAVLKAQGVELSLSGSITLTTRSA